tara:strand:+ start:3838 stop:6369 length:2532 start_codon:yes stop_codon:yes gene_type:complete
MVAEPSRDFKKQKLTQQLTAAELETFHKWLRTLQKGLTLEAESGFGNIRGRQDYFHAFLAREIVNTPIKLKDDVCLSFVKIAKSFNDYPNSQEPQRRRLVIDTRKILHELQKEYTPEPVLKPQRLEVYRHEHSLRSDILTSLTLDSSISDLKGVGEKIYEKLTLLGIFVVEDLLKYYPRDYVDYSELRTISSLIPGETATIVANVRHCCSFASPKNQNISMLDVYLQDQSGRIKITKFFVGRRFRNRNYLKSQEKLYPPASTVAVSGLVKEGPYGKGFTDPIIEVIEGKYSQLKSKSIGRIMPIYSLTEGLYADRFRNLIELVLPLSTKFPDPLGTEVVNSLSMPPKYKAISHMHFPPDKESLVKARKRLVFEEFFIFQLSLLFRKAQRRQRETPSLSLSLKDNGLHSTFIQSLPFSLTCAQKRVLSEIDFDLVRPSPMSRLVQGDVGSGKTVVAIASLLKAVDSGWQGALMAPTEVLAEQHYRNLCKFLPQLHVTVDLLTGSTPRRDRRRILDDLANGSLKILVGTHALIENPVSFNRLGLVVVDEQHRFGVRQRNLLLDKGLQPHLLTMTATPIPRTLALSLHGDLDVSQIDELPPGRSSVQTKLISKNQIDKAYDLIRDVVNRGQQAYIVLPLVDESEKLDLSSAINVHKQLSTDIFPELSVGLLHGRMKGTEKQSVIKQFLSKQFNILVSTTVIEVGVDVPNASVMVIDNADRFGLAQLHQLRGRVGRGSSKSHCLLIYDGSQKASKQRLDVLVNTNDGFEIAEIDLQMRGPGQVLGTRQSGLPDFALASLIEDSEVLELARKQATLLLEQDPGLVNHLLLRSLIKKQWQSITGNSHLN